MSRFLIVLWFLLLGVMACEVLLAARPAAAASADTEFYVGSMTTTNPEGTVVYRPRQTIAVRRTTERGRATIEEYVVHPGREIPTTLTWQSGAGPAVFRATASFSGTLTFTGPAWAWDAWTYDIAMSDGSGVVRGHGSRSASAIDTDKTFFAADGKPKARIEEHLERVNPVSFEATRSELLRTPPAPPR